MREVNGIMNEKVGVPKTEPRGSIETTTKASRMDEGTRLMMLADTQIPKMMETQVDAVMAISERAAKTRVWNEDEDAGT